jgi:hypothetical protein
MGALRIERRRQKLKNETKYTEKKHLYTETMTSWQSIRIFKNAVKWSLFEYIAFKKLLNTAYHHLHMPISLLWRVTVSPI